jgi:CheY-like chemotaxis protein
MNREIGAALLTLVGCEVETADNGKQAVAKARAAASTSS